MAPAATASLGGGHPVQVPSSYCSHPQKPHIDVVVDVDPVPLQRRLGALQQRPGDQLVEARDHDAHAQAAAVQAALERLATQLVLQVGVVATAKLLVLALLGIGLDGLLGLQSRRRSLHVLALGAHGIALTTGQLPAPGGRPGRLDCGRERREGDEGKVVACQGETQVQGTSWHVGAGSTQPAIAGHSTPIVKCAPETLGLHVAREGTTTRCAILAELAWRPATPALCRLATAGVGMVSSCLLPLSI